MDTTAIPVDELICQLLDAADGIPADAARSPVFHTRSQKRRTIAALSCSATTGSSFRQTSCIQASG
jgi:hypothetical protein